MFDFQKLTVYHRSKDFRKSIRSLIFENKFDRTTRDQLSRASMSIALNIAEGSSRFTLKDRKHFMVISRGSVFECLAILELLKESQEIT
ncbi:four helix bundle protein [Mangrovivirga cuniculi]|uniref:Four helix bundle protein n=1 Tax=Mangrovivirga cuniculi TaxID=2715131 RepID=A0A4D7JUU4_9BACT|nr:four helix bundle protein [Mangrovivirga cuniculi]QCK16352.1 four helix bundle protein [Mangrovivirga cuniculi]